MADSRWQIADGRWPVKGGWLKWLVEWSRSAEPSSRVQAEGRSRSLQAGKEPARASTSCLSHLFVLILLLSLLLPLGPGAAWSVPLNVGETVYTMQKDDSLWSLAEKYLGNGAAYTAIVAATNAQRAQDPTLAKITNPCLSQPGWKVLIPRPDDAGVLLASYKLPKPEKLILSTTTSTEDSGLLAYILPDFEARCNTKVQVIAVGTGQALKLGEDGNCDVVLVHARSREDAFVAAGYGVNHRDVMYNDFVVIGPRDDPAGIKGLADAAEAFKKIAEARARFISRGDESGTHTREKEVWEKAGIIPRGDWYVSAGQGMGEVLTMASEQLAYTLTDRGTYLARTMEGFDLIILVEGDPILFNPYGLMAVNLERYPHVNFDLAVSFINWFTSVPIQKMIGEFGQDKFGQPLFVPNSEAWRAAR